MLVVAVLVGMTLVLLGVLVAVVLVQDQLVMAHQELKPLVVVEVAVLEPRQEDLVVLVDLVSL